MTPPEPSSAPIAAPPPPGSVPEASQGRQWARAFGLAFFFFAIGCLIGSVCAAMNLLPSDAYPDPGEMRERLGGNLDLGARETYAIIFKQNTKVFVMLVAGMFLAGLPSIMFLLWFGFQTVGFVLAGPILKGTDPRILLAFLLPHGLIEIPTFLIAAAVGFRGTLAFHRFLIHNGPLVTPADEESLKRTVALTFLAVVAAAVVEATVTPWIGAQLLSQAEVR